MGRCRSWRAPNPAAPGGPRRGTTCGLRVVGGTFPAVGGGFRPSGPTAMSPLHSLSLWKRQANPPLPQHTGSTFYALASTAARSIVNMSTAQARPHDFLL